MITYTYNVGCRNCGQGDNKHMSIDMTEDYEEDRIYTEFEAMETIEELRRESGATCKFCGSENVEIFDIDLNSHPLSRYTDLVERCKQWREYMFQINIDKRINGLKLNTGGSDRLEREFFEASVKEILDVIEKRPPSVYRSLPNGNFFVCITGGFDYDGDVQIRIENLRTGGVTKNEVLNTIQPIVQQAGLSIEKPTRVAAEEFPILKGGQFKGSYFNSWFYADSLDLAQKENYPYSNVCFKIDENTLVAHGTGHGESPKEFMEINRDKNFIIDLSISPKTIKGKTVYYAKLA